MPNDTATTRLLYAILSQKCLKDIDWNKVAHDPILCEDITNGHAARMRFHRFKKQMDGPATKTRSRPNNHPNKNSPRKNTSKVSKSPRKGQGNGKGRAKEETETEGEDSQTSVLGGIKPEPGLTSYSRQGTAESESFSERVSGRSEREKAKMVKLQAGLSLPPSSTSRCENLQQPTPKTMPGTPSSSGRYNLDASPSPGPQSEHEGFAEMDEMGYSFNMSVSGSDALPGMSMPMYAPPPPPLPFNGASFGLGEMGMHGIGGGDMYQDIWHDHGHSGEGNGMQSGAGSGGGGGSVHVKTEPRWEEAYRHS